MSARDVPARQVARRPGANGMAGSRAEPLPPPAARLPGPDPAAQPRPGPGQPGPAPGPGPRGSGATFSTQKPDVGSASSHSLGSSAMAPEAPSPGACGGVAGQGRKRRLLQVREVLPVGADHGRLARGDDLADQGGDAGAGVSRTRSGMTRRGGTATALPAPARR